MVKVMIYERDVRTKLAETVIGKISLEDFSDWILSSSWNMHKDSTPETVKLVSSIQLLFAEKDDNAYSETEFQRRLQSLLEC